MRLERLAYDKMKIFLTYEDLEERGISTDNTWLDVPIIDELFQDMIAEASLELNFDPEGPVVIEVFSVPAQGVVIIVTKTEDLFDDLEEPVVEWEISNEKEDFLLFKFNDVEDVIQLANGLSHHKVDGGQLLAYQNYYYLLFLENDFPLLDVATFTSLVNEFAEKTDCTIHVLGEYGNVIFEESAIKNLLKHFL